MSFQNRLTQFGLDTMLTARYQNEFEFQRMMAARLRTMSMDALQSKLRDNKGVIVEDGEHVKRLKERITTGTEGLEIGYGSHSKKVTTVAQYVADQGHDTANAEAMSLMLMSDILDINIVHRDTNGSCKLISAYKPENPTIVLTGGKGHWDAVINCNVNFTNDKVTVTGGTVVRAAGDGNCGWNAVALALAAKAKELKINAGPVIEQRQVVSVPVSSPWEKRAKRERSDSTDGLSLDSLSIKKPKTSKEIITAQQEALEKFQEKATDKTVESTPVLETNQTTVEAAQIKTDHVLALKLAAEELEAYEAYQSSSFRP